MELKKEYVSLLPSCQLGKTNVIGEDSNKGREVEIDTQVVRQRYEVIFGSVVQRGSGICYL